MLWTEPSCEMTAGYIFYPTTQMFQRMCSTKDIPSLLLQQIFSDTYSQLMPLALEVESKGLLLSQLVDAEFEHLLFWQTIYTVLANSLYCSGKQSILY